MGVAISRSSMGCDGAWRWCVVKKTASKKAIIDGDGLAVLNTWSPIAQATRTLSIVLSKRQYKLACN